MISPKSIVAIATRIHFPSAWAIAAKVDAWAGLGQSRAATTWQL